MRMCYNCGGQIEDLTGFCPYCGAIQPEYRQGYNGQYQQGYTPVGQPGQNYGGQYRQGYQPVGQPGQNYGGQYQQGYTPVGQPGQNYGRQYQQRYQSAEDIYAQNMYQPGNAWDQGSVKARSSKKKIWIPIVSAVAVLAIALSVWLIFFAGKLTRGKAQKVVDNYVTQIEYKNVKGVLFATIPQQLLAQLINDSSSESDYYGYDYFMDDLDEMLDNDEVEYFLDNANIRFSNVKVSNVEQFSISGYMEYVIDLADEMGTDSTSAEDLLSDAGDGDIEKMESQMETALTMYNIDMEDIYMVDLSFDLYVNAEYYGEPISGNYSSKELYSDKAIIYKYEDEWYVVPTAVVGATAPAVIRYVEKSRKANDVSSAKTIKTAIETALGRESTYETMTTIHAGEMITVTEDGLSVLGTDIAEEIIGYIDEDGNIPELKYTSNGAHNFAFMVTDGGTVYVYIVGQDDEGNPMQWEVCPEIDDEYQ